MLQGTIYYLLSEKGRKESLLNGGTGKYLQKITGEIKTDEIEIFDVDYEGNVTLQVGFYASENGMYELENGVTYNIAITTSYEIYNKDSGYKPRLEAVKKIIEFDKEMSFEELIKYRKDLKERLENEKKELQKKLEIEIKKYEEIQKQKEEEVKKRIEEDTKQEEEKRQKRAIEEEKKRKEKEEIEKDREEWIQNHGSERLKLLREQGYDISKVYATERAKMELEEFTVDIENSCNFGDIEYYGYIPTIEDLKKVEELQNRGFDAEIVYAKTTPTNEINRSKGGIYKVPAFKIKYIYDTEYNAYSKIEVNSYI